LASTDRQAVTWSSAEGRMGRGAAKWPTADWFHSVQELARWL
jgi:hypothetical protein